MFCVWRLIIIGGLFYKRFSRKGWISSLFAPEFSFEMYWEFVNVQNYRKIPLTGVTEMLLQKMNGNASTLPCCYRYVILLTYLRDKFSTSVQLLRAIHWRSSAEMNCVCVLRPVSVFCVLHYVRRKCNVRRPFCVVLGANAMLDAMEKC